MLCSVPPMTQPLTRCQIPLQQEETEGRSVPTLLWPRGHLGLISLCFSQQS